MVTIQQQVIDPGSSQPSVPSTAQYLGQPKASIESNVSNVYAEFTATNAFAPKQEIQRTFYSSPKRQQLGNPYESSQGGGGYGAAGVAIIERDAHGVTPNRRLQQQAYQDQQYQAQQQHQQALQEGPSRHVYGSPNRRNNIHRLHDQLPADDFFSKFGQGGSGAPNRDAQGNVITVRSRPSGQPVTNQNVNQSQDEIKQAQQNEYQRELLQQIQEAQARKQRAKDEMARYDLLQEQKIKRDLQDLNQRERADIAKERGQPPPQEQPPVSRNSNGSQLNTYTAAGELTKIRRRDPNAAYQANNFYQQPAQPESNVQNTNISVSQDGGSIPMNISSQRLNQSNSQELVENQNRFSNRPPPVPSTLRPRPSQLAYSSQGNFMSMMQQANGTTHAHKELKSQQMKFQSTLEELRTQSKQIKSQTQQAQQDLDRMMQQLQFTSKTPTPRPISYQRQSLPAGIPSPNANNMSMASDYKHQWNMVLSQDISNKAQYNAQQAASPILFPQIKTNSNSLQRAGNDLVKSSGKLLQTETARVPVDDILPTKKSRIEIKVRPELAVDEAQQRAQRAQILSQKDQGSPLDREYVSNFLKEIDEIETINLRADKYIEDRTFETQMRQAPRNQTSQQPASTQISSPPTVQTQPTASQFMTPTQQLEQKVQQHAELAEERDLGGGSSFFLTESPDVHLSRGPAVNTRNNTDQHFANEQQRVTGGFVSANSMVGDSADQHTANFNPYGNIQLNRNPGSAVQSSHQYANNQGDEQIIMEASFADGLATNKDQQVGQNQLERRGSLNSDHVYYDEH